MTFLPLLTADKARALDRAQEVVEYLKSGPSLNHIQGCPARTGRGVTDDRAQALQIAETYLRSGQASAASVEQSRLDLGMRTLTSGYQRTGQGWRGRRVGSGVCWEPIVPAPVVAP